MKKSAKKAAPAKSAAAKKSGDVTPEMVLGGTILAATETYGWIKDRVQGLMKGKKKPKKKSATGGAKKKSTAKAKAKAKAKPKAKSKKR